MSSSRRLAVAPVYCCLALAFSSLALADSAPRCTRNLDGPTFPMPMVGPALKFSALLSFDSDGDGTNERFTFAGYPIRQLVRLEYTATGQVVPHDAVLLSDGSFFDPPLTGDVDGDGTIDIIDPTYSGVALHRGNGDGTFGAAVLLSGIYTGTRPTVGDIDGDGTDELVIAVTFGGFGYEMRAYSWVAAVGWQQELVVVCRAPDQQLLGGDFNGDGLYDVAYRIANDIERRIDVLLGDREHPVATLQETHPASDLFVQGVFDSDGDGRDELLAREFSPYRHIARLDWESDPTPRFVERWRVELPANVSSLAPVAEDLDDDGDDDLQLIQGDYYNNQGYVLMECSASGCESASRGVLGRQLVDVRDFDGDGVGDALIQQQNEGLGVLHGIGPLQFAEPLRISPQADDFLSSSGDLNGDGRLDLVTASDSYPSGSSFTVRLGNGDGTFSPQPGPPTLPGHSNDRVLDIDGDGKLDLFAITASSQGFGLNIAWGRGDGSFEPWQSLALPGRFRDIDFGDVDGDGALDLALVSDQNVPPSSVRTQLFLLVARRYIPGPTWPPRSIFTVMRLADVDGDGWLDMLLSKETKPGTAGSPQELLWTRMIKGVPTTTQKFSNETFSSLSIAAAADLDGDAMADLFLYEENSESRVLHGDGGRGNTRTIWRGKSHDLYSRDVLRDVDGDGVLDLVARNSPIRFRRGDGTGSFGPVEGPWIGGGSTAQFGDVDGSGTTDLVLPHYSALQRMWVSQLASGSVASDDTSPPTLRLAPLPNLDYSTDTPAWDGAWRIAGRAIDECRSARVTSIAMKLFKRTGLEPVSYRYATREEIRIYRRTADGVTRVVLFGPNEASLRARLDQGRASGLALPRNHVMKLYEWRNNGETSPDDPDASLVERVEFDGGLPARVDSYLPSAGIEFALEGRDWLGKSATLTETFGQAKRRFCETEGAEVLACRED